MGGQQALQRERLTGREYEGQEGETDQCRGGPRAGERKRQRQWGQSVQREDLERWEWKVWRGGMGKRRIDGEERGDGQQHSE